MNSLSYNGVSVSICVNGRPIKTHYHDGRIWVESREGTEYSLEIKNSNGYRVEVVASVDGLGVIDGSPASINDRGYVVEAWGSLSIKGYRRSNTEVGAFMFTKRDTSYAAGKGSGENTGVIAVAVWSEKRRPESTITFVNKYYQDRPWIVPNPYPTWYSSIVKPYHDGYVQSTGASIGFGPVGSATTDDSVNCSSSNYISQTSPLQNCSFVPQSHGTTWGSSISDSVTSSEFERDAIVFQTEIRYDSRDGLRARGVKLTSEKQIAMEPKGFPRDSFAEPPTGWRG